MVLAQATRIEVERYRSRARERDRGTKKKLEKTMRVVELSMRLPGYQDGCVWYYGVYWRVLQ